MSKGFGKTQLAILEFIKAPVEADFTVSVSELEEYTGIKKSNISRTLKPLITAGLVIVDSEVCGDVHNHNRRYKRYMHVDNVQKHKEYLKVSESPERVAERQANLDKCISELFG